MHNFSKDKKASFRSQQRNKKDFMNLKYNL